ncbi:MAG: ribbon-helix-helix domain-containing protein [Methanosarcinales archaeon]
MTKLITVNLKLTEGELEGIDNLVECGLYPSRSDFIESILKKYIRENKLDIPQCFIEMQKEAEKKGLTYEQVMKDLRKIRHEVYAEEYGKD